MLKKYYHWIVMVSCCLLTAASVGILINSYGVMYSPLAAKLGVGRGTATLHATILGIVSGFATPFIVKAANRFGLRPVTLTGIILVTISLLLSAFTESIMVINVAGAIRGVGSACVYIPIVTIVLGNWFIKGGGTVVGVALSFSGLAGAIFSPVVNGYVTEHGVSATYILLLILFVCLSLPMLLFVTLRPEDMHMKAFGEEEYGNGKALEKKMVEDSSSDKGSKNTVIYVIMMVYSIIAVPVTCIGPHLSGYAESIGMGSSIGALMLSAAMIGNILSKLLNGILIDAIGSFKATMIMLFTTFTGLLFILFARMTPLLLLGAFLFGSAYAVGAASIPALLRRLYGPEKYGSVYSKITPVSSVAYSLCLTLAGYAYDFSGSYAPVLITGIVFALSSVCIVLILQNKKERAGA